MPGPRGVTVLSIAGIAGICLAVLGWTQRGTGLVAVQAAASPAASATVSAGASSPPATKPAASQAATVASSPVASSPAAGPLLSSEPYAPWAYQVWPGPLNAEAQMAMSGFVLKVRRQANGIAVIVSQDGVRMTDVSHFYPGGAKVYVLDSNLGDEGGSVDYNVSDDGLTVTNAQGQVLP